MPRTRRHPRARPHPRRPHQEGQGLVLHRLQPLVQPARPNRHLQGRRRHPDQDAEVHPPEPHREHHVPVQRQDPGAPGLHVQRIQAGGPPPEPGRHVQQHRELRHQRHHARTSAAPSNSTTRLRTSSSCTRAAPTTGATSTTKGSMTAPATSSAPRTSARPAFPRTCRRRWAPRTYPPTPPRPGTSRAKIGGQFDVSYFATAAGQHQFKAGVKFDQIGNDVLTGETGNLVRLFWDRRSSRAHQRGPYGYYQVRSNGVNPQQGFITQGNIHSNNIGLFLQDAWTINNKLTINLGLRTENENIPNFADASLRPPGHRDQVQLQGQARAARRLRLGHQAATARRRSTAAGASSTTSPSWNCRAAASAATSGSSTTTRWTPPTGRPSTPRAALPRARAR